MTDKSGRRIQLTLTGEDLVVEPRECEYYDGCRGKATHAVTLLVNYDHEEDVLLCQSCVDEVREYKEGDAIREMTIQEKWGATDD